MHLYDITSKTMIKTKRSSSRIQMTSNKDSIGRANILRYVQDD